MDEVFLPAGIYPGSMPEKPFYLATSALIRDGSGKVLLLKRAADDPINPEKWDLPGGTLDPGETFDRALRHWEEPGCGLPRHVAGAGLPISDEGIAPDHDL